jgi:carboxyl-terminal processing protease
MEENKNSYSGIKGFFLGVLVTLAVGSAVFLVKNWDYVVHKEMKPTELGAKTKVSDIYERIQDAYLGEIDDEKLTDYMCTGLVAGLEDKYSTYYTQEQYEKMIESANGHYSGIGISILADESGKVVIESCGENTPAAEAGITAGDILLEIDGTRVTGMTASEAAKLIQNKKEGEAFSMTLNREGKDYTVEIAVREVEAISVAGSMLDEQVGYIRISEFTGVTSQQFADSYQKLKDQNMTKLIIDLRSNPGGLVSGVCDTLRQILPKGLIVYTEDKYGNRKEQTCDGETPIDIPMVVLVNGSSASASEIFAGAVQDYEVGTIVGTVTYGKGVVQDTYPLDNGGAVKLTVSHYFTPKGNDINGKGITPDVVCELPDDASEDLQIEKAKEILGH